MTQFPMHGQWVALRLYASNLRSTKRNCYGQKKLPKIAKVTNLRCSLVNFATITPIDFTSVPTGLPYKVKNAFNNGGRICYMNLIVPLRIWILAGVRLLAILSVFSCSSFYANESPAKWMAGFAKVDVTPNEPIRMAGYGNRDRPSESTDTPLFVRAMALRNESSPIHLIFSVDTIGLPGEMTSSLAEQIEKKHGLSRSQIVFCSTHTHCGPDLSSELSNIFAKELTSGEVTVGLRYRDLLSKAILEGADKAIGELAPAKLAYAQGSVGFAANRRVLKEGRWSTFGVQSDGPVDHTVPVLRITDSSGTLRGTVFNYACHCTTLGGDHYAINSEWAGYATNKIEAANSGSVALCTIGCGADANPFPRGKIEFVQQHGLSLASEVLRVLASPMTQIDQSVAATFGYAGLLSICRQPKNL